MQKTKVLIVIPAFNEGRAIKRLVAEIQQLHPEYPILVVNDGSSDNTATEAEAAGASVITLPFNLGIGGAVQTGYKWAHQNHFDVCVQIDGDAQHDPKGIAHLIEPVASGQADLAIGSRFLSLDPGFKSTAMRRLGIRFFVLLLRYLTGIYLTDPTSGFRATGKKLIAQFADIYPIDFPEPEVIQVAKRLGSRVVEVPVRMRKRLGGRSSIRDWKTLYYMVKVTLAIFIDTLRKKS